MLNPSHDSEATFAHDGFLQALAAKSLETVRLTEALSVSPDDETARVALAEQLSDLRRAAGELGLVHLEAALTHSLSRLDRESFGPAALVAVRVLAWRYESLATMPSESGTHRLVAESELRWNGIQHPVERVGAVRPESLRDVPVLTLSADEEELGPPAEASLRGRRVLVADDEEDVRGFYVEVLREAGARVIEAHDGLRALELARSEEPDLILADVVMPRLDGLGLCAALRHEPALDGVPFVLVSWREDFLHHIRELRPDAQGYLRKRLPARQILDRAFRVLEPLTRLEGLLTSDCVPSGDLEELGVSRLLRATQRLRPNACVVLQDPWSLIELELRQGRMVYLTRTAIDGAITQGATALPALVGMSSGRFVVAEPTARDVDEERESLDDLFAHASRRLGVLLTVIATHPDCRVEFDAEVLASYVRHSPAGVQQLIARLVAGQAPLELWESGAASEALVKALLDALARQGAIQDVVLPALEEGTVPAPELDEHTISDSFSEPSKASVESKIARSSPAAVSPTERANARAHSAAAMYHEPVNQAPKTTHAVWRPGAAPRVRRDESGAGSGAETQRTPRLLGLAFVILLAATVGLLLWGELMRAPPPAEGPAAEPKPEQPRVAEEPAAPAREPSTTARALDLSAFAGTLRPGVGPSLNIAEGQGVLELLGPSDVSVEVDGVEQGTLPSLVVLEQGRHTVRYRVGDRSTYRFYYVKPGTTRAARVVRRPGGLVDAR